MALAALYAFFAGSLSGHELALAIGLGLAVTAWTVAADLAAPAPLRFPPRALAYGAVAVARLPGRTVAVAAALLRVLATGVGGGIERRPFHRGRTEPPEEAGRRAAVVLGLSLAPDGVVLRLPVTQEVLELHSLGGGAPRGDAKWPA